MNATSFPKNPYIIGRPIHQANNFYGREEIFQFIEDNLLNEAQVILLFGQRRIGKTSIINQIPQAVNLENFVFVPLSLQGKSHKSLGEVLFELSTDIKDSICDYLETSTVNITIPTVGEFKKKSTIFVEEFLAQIHNILEANNLVLLIDEFDVLEDAKKDSAINQFFPYLYSILPKEKQLYIIPVVGRKLDDMPTLLRLFKDAPHRQIGKLDKYDAKQLICQPTAGILNYDANVIQAILDLSGGHPYFIQLICFAIFGRLRQEQRYFVKKEDVAEIIDKAIEYGEGGLAWFYAGLTMPEKLIFSVIAELQEHKNRDLWQFLKQQKISKKKRLVSAHKRLLSWEFTRQEWQYIPESIQVEKVTVELVRLWLLKRHPVGQEIKIYQQWLRYDSKLRRYLPSVVFALVIVLSGFWWFSPWGQIQQVRWNLIYLSGRLSKDSVIDANYAVVSVAIAFAKDGKLNQSRQILEQALVSANQIDNHKDKAEALIAVAAAYSQLNQNQDAFPILEQALISVNQIDNHKDKAEALIAVAEAHGQSNKSSDALNILEQVLISVNQIDNYTDKASILSEFVKVHGNLGQSSKKLQILEQVLISANQINDYTNKATILIVLAEAHGQLNQSPKAIKILEQALVSANEIHHSYFKAPTLSSLAKAYGQLNQSTKALNILEQALASANDINYSYSKAPALSLIAEVYGQLNQSTKALNILEEALVSANQIDNSWLKAERLIMLAEAYGQLNQNPRALKILEQARISANQIEHSKNRDNSLNAIAQAYAEQKQWNQARKVINLITIEDIEAEALAEVLTIWAENKNPAVVEKEEE